MASPHSTSEILRRIEARVNKLHSPNVKKAHGVSSLLRIVSDLLHVVTSMYKKMSMLEKQVQELQAQLSNKEDRSG
jgi:hypothetical protein